ncbi:MAG: hypothetical protein MMC33_001035 [Icmadophila ericetorum]|nr:hypothetical protein [Icmadophila ericetorum]
MFRCFGRRKASPPLQCTEISLPYDVVHEKPPFDLNPILNSMHLPAHPAYNNHLPRPLPAMGHNNRYSEKPARFPMPSMPEHYSEKQAHFPPLPDQHPSDKYYPSTPVIEKYYPTTAPTVYAYAYPQGYEGSHRAGKRAKKVPKAFRNAGRDSRGILKSEFVTIGGPDWGEPDEWR